jgi:hypothetical protein
LGDVTAEGRRAAEHTSIDIHDAGAEAASTVRDGRQRSHPFLA